MGKAHSNAYAQVGHFYDSRTESGERCCAAATRPPSPRWRIAGAGKHGNRLARRHRSCRHRYRRYRPSESSPRTGGHRRRRSRQDRLLREATGAVGRRRSRDGRGGTGPSHARVVQLPARAGHCLRASADRRRPAWADLPLQRGVQAAVGPGHVTGRHLEDGSGAGRFGRGGRSAHASSRYGPVSERSDHARNRRRREPSCRTVESTMR